MAGIFLLAGFATGILFIPIIIFYILILIPSTIYEGLRVSRLQKGARLCGSTEQTSRFTP